MRYALLVYSDQSDWAGIPEEEATRLRAESMPRWLALFEELGKADPAAEGKELVDGKPAVYVCERFACRAPVSDPDELTFALT